MLALTYSRITWFLTLLMPRRYVNRLVAWWRGDWTQTRSGARWYPHSPRAEDVIIEDLGACAYINRFGGHAGLCSDAEHQYRVAEHLRSLGFSAWIQLCGAMHDTPEVYAPGDIPAPVLRGNFIHRLWMWGLRRMRRRAAHAVFDRLGLPRELPPEVHHADLVLLRTEVRDRMRGGIVGWDQGRDLPPPLSQKTFRWQPEDAERRWWTLVARLAHVAAMTTPGLTPTQIAKLHELAEVAADQVATKTPRAA